MFGKKPSHPAAPVDPVKKEFESLGKTPAMLDRHAEMQRSASVPRPIVSDNYPEERLKKK